MASGKLLHPNPTLNPGTINYSEQHKDIINYVFKRHGKISIHCNGIVIFSIAHLNVL